MPIATLSIDLVAQLAKLQAGLDKAGRLSEKHAAQIEAQYAKLNAAATAVGTALGTAFAGASLATFVKTTTDAIDALNDAADATGGTIEGLSGLEDVARRNGGTLGDVTGILVKFNSVLKEADGKNSVSKALKAIGLDAADLRKLDPSEALQLTAKALAGFADDGNKARTVQELFGKSIREAAPFLKDLAEAGELNASVTTEQAAEAEKFNKLLFGMQTQAGNLGRQLVLATIPALNEMSDRVLGVNTTAKEFSGLTKALMVPLEAVAVLGVNVAYVFRTIGTEIGGIAAQAAALARGDFAGIAEIRRAMVEDAAAGRAEVDARSAQLLGLSSGQVGGNNANPASQSSTKPPSKPKIPDWLGDGAKAVKVRLSGSDLLARELGGNLEKLLGKDGPLADVSGVLSTNDALAGFNAEMAQLTELLGNTRTAKLEKERADMLLLAKAYEEGRLGLVGSAEAMALYTEAAQTRLGTLPAEIKPAIDEMTELTKEFQRNVQDILGDGIESVLKGDFDNIGNAFGNMLRKMAAQAIAADIGNLILGQAGANGVRSGGVITSLMSLFGFAKGGVFAGGLQKFAAGGIVGSPTLFGMAGGRMGLMGEAGPEAIMPLKRGRDGRLGVAGGGGTTINNYHVAAGVTRNELVTALQMMAQTLTGQTDAKLRRAGIQ